jgi:hypothetical protein
MKGSLSFDFGAHVLYAATRHGKAVAVLDGQAGDEYEAIVEAPFFNRFGPGYAYVARNEQKWFVVIDGKASRAYDAVLPGSVTFSRGRRRVAYAAATGARWAVYTEGRLGMYYDEVSAPVFSDDGQHLSYLGRLGGSWYVVLDGTPSKPFDSILSSRPVFSKDGAVSVFAVREGWLHVVQSVLEYVK